MIRPNPDRDWLLARAKDEANRFICVGGLAFTLQKSGDPASPQEYLGKLAFSKLISLRRRELRLSLVQLAEKAKIDLDELVEIESGQSVVPEPRTVCQLAAGGARAGEVAGSPARRPRGGAGRPRGVCVLGVGAAPASPAEDRHGLPRSPGFPAMAGDGVVPGSCHGRPGSDGPIHGNLPKATSAAGPGSPAWTRCRPWARNHRPPKPKVADARRSRVATCLCPRTPSETVG